MTDVGTCRVFRVNPRAVDVREDHGRVSFSTSHLPASAVVVSVEGDVDATNNNAFARYVERQIAGATQLEIDLRMVDFFGTAGFAALYNINVVCSRNEVVWRVRAGRELRRLLAICDPDRGLPLEEPRSALDDLQTGARDRKFFVGRDH